MNGHEPDANASVETFDGERVDVREEDVEFADAVSAIGLLEKSEPISIKIEGMLAGIHISSRMFVGKPGETRANVGGLFVMRKAEWLSFVAALKLGAKLSDGRVEVEAPHEPQRTAAGDLCLTCGGGWPECGA